MTHKVAFLLNQSVYDIINNEQIHETPYIINSLFCSLDYLITMESKLISLMPVNSQSHKL